MKNDLSLDVIVPVYNGAATVGQLINRLLEMPKPDGLMVGIIVVDDASTDQTAEVLESFDNPLIQLVRHNNNMGRAGACNSGVLFSKASHIIFLDVDCFPCSDDYFLLITAALQSDAVLLFGPIGSDGDDFWSRYISEVESRRAELLVKHDNPYAMTSCNLAVSKLLYLKAGGFNTDYSRYGFEDRDLIVKLLAHNSRPLYLPGARVEHKANYTVKSYCQRMEDSARYSAPLFYRDHPDVYRTMLYSRLDPLTSTFFRKHLVFTLLSRLAFFFQWQAQHLVDNRFVPYKVQLYAVKAAAMMSYVRGAKNR